MEIQQRPNLHLRGATAEELEAARFKGATELPWSDIYLRLFQDANGDLIRVMRCDIPAEAGAFHIGTRARHPSSDGAKTPPPWWPWDRQREEGKPRSAFRVPDWFEPVGDSVFFTERRVPGSDIAWEGIYVNYDDEAGRLWLWQWRRNDWQPPQTERITVEPLDALAQGFARLIAVRHPVAEGGWLRQPGQDIVRSGVPAEVFPAGVTRVDLCLRPQAEGNADHDFLMRLHGVEEADLPLCLRDHPLRALPANAKPPLAAWALRAGAASAVVPRWHRPRWATAVVMPGQNSVHGGRWVAYDRGQKQLLVRTGAAMPAKPWPQTSSAVRLCQSGPPHCGRYPSISPIRS